MFAFGQTSAHLFPALLLPRQLLVAAEARGGRGTRGAAAAGRHLCPELRAQHWTILEAEQASPRPREVPASAWRLSLPVPQLDGQAAWPPESGTADSTRAREEKRSLLTPDPYESAGGARRGRCGRDPERTAPSAARRASRASARQPARTPPTSGALCSRGEYMKNGLHALKISSQ